MNSKNLKSLAYQLGLGAGYEIIKDIFLYVRIYHKKQQYSGLYPKNYREK